MLSHCTRIFLWSFVFFFFSSRRRHTRLQGDWSSDVCSSDLGFERATCRGSRHRDGGNAVRSGAPPRQAVQSCGRKWGNCLSTHLEWISSSPLFHPKLCSLVVGNGGAAHPLQVGGGL